MPQLRNILSNSSIGIFLMKAGKEEQLASDLIQKTLFHGHHFKGIARLRLS